MPFRLTRSSGNELPKPLTRKWGAPGISTPVARRPGGEKDGKPSASAAHRVGIVHRDVKPENLMRRRDGYVKVLDFGIAKALARGDSSGASADLLAVTQPGVVLGTLRYMSPEQANGEEVDARTDVWSLGVVLYELASGRPPFDQAGLTAMLGDISTRNPAPLSSLVPHAPEALCRVVERAMRKERGERFPTAAEMAEALEAVVHAPGQTGVARAVMAPPGQPGRGYTTVRLSAGGGADSELPSAPRRRRTLRRARRR